MIDDVLIVIASSGGVQVACTMACVSRDWRAAVVKGVGESFDARRALVELGEGRGDALMGEVMEALALSAAKVKRGAHRKKHNYRGGFYKIFSPETTRRLFRRNGAWGGLEARLRRRRACRARRQLVF